MLKDKLQRWTSIASLSLSILAVIIALAARRAIPAEDRVVAAVHRQLADDALRALAPVYRDFGLRVPEDATTVREGLGLLLSFSEDLTLATQPGERAETGLAE